MVTVQLTKLFFNALDRIWNDYKSCKTAVYVYGNDKYIGHFCQSKAEVLLHLVVNFSELLKLYPFYVEQKITQEIMTDNRSDFFSQLELLEKVDLSKTILNMEQLFVSYTFRPFNADECLVFAESLEKVFPSHKEYLSSKEFCEKAVECLKHDLESVKDADLEELETKMKELCNLAPLLEEENVVSEIGIRVKEYSDYIDAQAEAYMDEYRHWPDDFPDREEQEIDNLFATIKERK